MLEIPEAIVISNQLNQTVRGKKIKSAVANSSPHKFAWYHGNPSEYNVNLTGKTLGITTAYAGRIEIEIEDVLLAFHDGVNLRFFDAASSAPSKHQLFLKFLDDSCLVATVAMYGGIMCFFEGEMDDNFYHNVSRSSVSPLSDAFDYDYFESLFDEESLNMSVKAFLATRQRIPGLGNGVLQDILLNAKIHPKRKINTLTKKQRHDIFSGIKLTLAEMINAGGRDTERDLFGNLGEYKTKLSKNNVLMICENCGGQVKKESYLGGSIYYCLKCQV